MGNFVSCERCPIAVQNSVMTFSNDLVLKLTQGIEPKQLSVKEMIERETDDYRNIELLRCIDDGHSEMYGLTYNRVNMMIDRVMDNLTNMNDTNVSEYKEVLKCYGENPNCSLKCAVPVEAYTSFIDGEIVHSFKKRKEDAKVKA